MTRAPGGLVVPKHPTRTKKKILLMNTVSYVIHMETLSIKYYMWNYCLCRPNQQNLLLNLFSSENVLITNVEFVYHMYEETRLVNNKDTKFVAKQTRLMFLIGNYDP